MRRRVSMLARYLLLGALMNVLVAWSFMAAHGRVNSGWREYFNPRECYPNPMVFFAIHRTGAEWVVGDNRDGELERFTSAVSRATGAEPVVGDDGAGELKHQLYLLGATPDHPWWPSEAVTLRYGEFGAAAGWPLLSLCAWRTVVDAATPAGAANTDHWGVVLLEAMQGPPRGVVTFPVILPLRPMWPGVAVNTLLYALITAIAFEGWRPLRASWRLARGLCPACALPVTGLEKCPKCGLAVPARRRTATRLMSPQHLAVLVRFLLLGALMNVAVAWAFMAVHGRVKSVWGSHFYYARSDPLRPFQLDVDHRLGVEWVTGSSFNGCIYGRHTGGTPEYRHDPWWPPEATYGYFGEFGAAAGWPLLSFCAWRTAVPAATLTGAAYPVHWGVVLLDTTPNSGSSDLQIPLLLPLRPIWRGFVVNTLLYALVTAIAFKGWPTLRARRRVAHGLCTACAYPVTGLERCPECGLAAPTVHSPVPPTAAPPGGMLAR